MICLCDHLSPLLWAHYASGHSGVCLEFDATQEPFRNAVRVEYEQDYPTPDFANGNVDQLARIGLLTKAAWWEYEKEFRLITAEMDGSYARSTDGYFPVTKTATIAVILGQACPGADPEAGEAIRQLLEQHAPSVHLRMASRNIRSFSLDYRRIHVDVPLAKQIKGYPSKPATT
ncbi:hypothetical protein BWI17_13595 [Betaproteobacteria bacterium GR16-43]|nr:hypothetical protein BWI17_13595 [Betaproteobacteria bacterium GR16-43]